MAFPNAERFIGLELENKYVNLARQLLSQVASPILVIGNPPWVTNSDIGVLSGKNLPEKSNIHNRNGFSAINGSSNFDISEWMLLRQLDWIETHGGCIAMLCKTSVARKVLRHAWKRKKMAINCQMVQMMHYGISMLLLMRVSSLFRQVKNQVRTAVNFSRHSNQIPPRKLWATLTE